ncbi:hypothetical protein ACIP5N_33910 [Streptomyces sp. NPDC088768]|uniref:hypothetical protein n=1 Tax=Streptomyces sp. NPDC088768 TaxID=3365894 RepID=UPI003819CDBB
MPTSTTSPKVDDLVRSALAARARAATATARNIWTKERFSAAPPCGSDVVKLLRRLVAAQAAEAFWRHAKGVADEAGPTRVHADVMAWLVRRERGIAHGAPPSDPVDAAVAALERRAQGHAARDLRRLLSST